MSLTTSNPTDLNTLRINLNESDTIRAKELLQASGKSFFVSYRNMLDFPFGILKSIIKEDNPDFSEAAMASQVCAARKIIADRNLEKHALSVILDSPHTSDYVRYEARLLLWDAIASDLQEMLPFEKYYDQYAYTDVALLHYIKDNPNTSIKDINDTIIEGVGILELDSFTGLIRSGFVDVKNGCCTLSPAGEALLDFDEPRRHFLITAKYSNPIEFYEEEDDLDDEEYSYDFESNTSPTHQDLLDFENPLVQKGTTGTVPITFS